MKNIGIFLTGAITGALAGIILAPNSGKKTREMISKEMDHTMKDGEKTLFQTSKELRSEYNKNVDNLSKKGREMVNEAKEAAKLN